MSSRRIMLLLALTALAMMTIDARGGGPFQGARQAAYGVTQPVRTAVAWIIGPISDSWQGAVHYDDLERENDELRRRVSQLEGQMAELPDIAGELDDLRQATQIDFAEQYGRVVATVSADRNTGAERIVELDRGQSDGVFEGMPVVTGDGLVGRIILADGGRSQMRLMSDPRFNVGVVSRGTRAIGVATGTGNLRLPVLDLEDGAAGLVESGARFETSGLDGSRYPGGIPVGRLSEIEGELRLEPLADLDRLAFVTIILTPESLR